MCMLWFLHFYLLEKLQTRKYIDIDIDIAILTPKILIMASNLKNMLLPITTENLPGVPSCLFWDLIWMFPPKPDELVCVVPSFQTWSFQVWNLRVEDLRMQAVSVSAVRTLNLYWGTDPAAVSRSRPPIGIQLAQRGWSLLLCKDVGEKDEWKCETKLKGFLFVWVCVSFNRNAIFNIIFQGPG